MLSVIVLAAGLSSRMGPDNKLLLPFNNKPVIVTVVKTIIDAGFREVIIVTGHEAALVKDALKDLEVQFVYNQQYASGMTTSIQHGISLAKGNGYMICLSDMVMIEEDEYKILGDAFDKQINIDPKCIFIPQYKNEKGNPVIFSSFYKEAILQNSQMEGCKNIVQSNKEHIYSIDMTTPHVLQDFDYPDDYKNLVPIL